MKNLMQGNLLGGAIGLLWAAIAALSVAVVLAFSTGAAVKPGLLTAAITGLAVGLFAIHLKLPKQLKIVALSVTACAIILALNKFQPFALPLSEHSISQYIALAVLSLAIGWPLYAMLDNTPSGPLDRHQFELPLLEFCSAAGGVFFVAIVAVPFYVMVMTSLKSQQELIANPLDFSLDLSRGWDLFRSYVELFRDYRFGQYLGISFFVSVLTVFITLAFSVPGAYAVARLRFKGRAVMSRSILLIYMVPMIVLALPIYIAFSMLELRNTLTGLVLIYPMTTIPVALYMLQGYFRGLPAEIEEAGLMDGLSRLAVIRKITLPLSLPALASVSLYVFMIAWNEFLLAFMLLDDPKIFTLTRGVSMLNSSEIPRQHLMAGSVLATVPVMVIFLGLERFMTQGLTAGSVKG